MKRAAAIVLSLVFVWLQAMSSAQTSFRLAPAGFACCDCKKACCVSAATRDAQPSPAVPVTGKAAGDFSLFAPALVAWILPTRLPPQISSFTSAPLPALAVPLFMRHCALLI